MLSISVGCLKLQQTIILLLFNSESEYFLDQFIDCLLYKKSVKSDISFLECKLISSNGLLVQNSKIFSTLSYKMKKINKAHI